MRIFITFLVALSALVGTAFAGQKAPGKVLMVVSSYGVDQGETQPGFEFDELAKAYLVFAANGLSIDIASPKGGAVEADKYNPEKAYNAQFLADPDVVNKLNNTLNLSAVKSQHYNAIFVVGGKGAMFDFHNNQALQTLVADIYQRNGIVSAVCHGPAALVNVKLANGDYLVSGKRVNGFTNEEEKAFGKKWAPKFEFMLESKLIERGASFEKAPMMLKHVAVDGNLVTGQNPFSTAATAIEVVKAMGIKPVAMKPFKDDATIELAAQMLTDVKPAAAELAAHTERYQPELIAMYGYYRMMFAASKSDLQQAVNLMEVGRLYMDNPQLIIALAQGYQKLDDVASAKQRLTELLQRNPKFEPAQTLLAKLEQSKQ